ncbi:MAG: hypothetical protein KBT27_04555 [Prevotellaceae bacterium]|nr:hypothetical protein [Candidatus Faecinaster equi]
MILTNEDIEFIKYSKEQLNKGRYSDIKKLNEVYNRVYVDNPNFKKENIPMCGPCIRRKICEMYNDMEIVLREAEKETQV